MEVIKGDTNEMWKFLNFLFNCLRVVNFENPSFLSKTPLFIFRSPFLISYKKYVSWWRWLDQNLSQDTWTRQNKYSTSI